jgi:hypothetical protein
MDQFHLIRGGTDLGVVTYDPDQQVDGSLFEVGWLEPSVEFEAVRQLFEREQHLQDEATRVEVQAEQANSSTLLKLAADLQREIMRPGVWLISFTNGKQHNIAELHIQEHKVFLR